MRQVGRRWGTPGVQREYKASLQIDGKDQQLADHEIEQRMLKHAEFADGHDLPAYEWVAHSAASRQKMESALTALKAKAAAQDAVRAHCSPAWPSRRL